MLLSGSRLRFEGCMRVWRYISLYAGDLPDKEYDLKLNSIDHERLSPRLEHVDHDHLFPHKIPFHSKNTKLNKKNSLSRPSLAHPA
jgi:hypothetical protein